MTIIKTKILAISFFAAFLSACGGGSSSPASDVDNNDDTADKTTTENVNSATGIGISAAGTSLTAAQSTPPVIGAAVAGSGITDGGQNLDNSEAFRFLQRATFGPTLKTIDALSQTTPVEWIGQQMSLPATHMSEKLKGENDRWAQYVNVWWKTAINSEDQLRQRVAFALSEILVISAKDKLGDEQPGVARYYDLLVDHAFGNFRELIEEVTLSPVMGEYLSMKGNRKPDPERNIRPDENYARELMQLFTIGLVQLNQDGSVQIGDDGVPLPTYTQDTIEAFAHVFTGWHFANVDDFRWPTTADYISPMQAYEDYHDKGTKTLLNGFEIPAGQSAYADLTAALDNIFNHPNVGPFISKQLIQRLVTSNPSSAYVSDVASVFNDNGEGVRGSLGSVVSAILLHEEALYGFVDQPDRFGKLKEPALRVTALWRAFMPDSIHKDFNYAWAADEISQAPLNANSVFNFFTPGFSQPGAIRDNNMVSPEFEIHDETSIINITNRLLANSIWSHNYKYSSTENKILINIDREVDMVDEADAFLDHLNALLLGGRMSEGLRAEAKLLMDSRDYDWSASQRVVEAIWLILSSPEAAVQL